MIGLNRILVGDARETLRKLPEGFVDCIVTSPPYFRLRNYQHADQLGLEAQVDQWVEGLYGVRSCNSAPRPEAAAAGFARRGSRRRRAKPNAIEVVMARAKRGPDSRRLNGPQGSSFKPFRVAPAFDRRWVKGPKRSRLRLLLLPVDGLASVGGPRKDDVVGVVRAGT